MAVLIVVDVLEGFVECFQHLQRHHVADFAECEVGLKLAPAVMEYIIRRRSDLGEFREVEVSATTAIIFDDGISKGGNRRRRPRRRERPSPEVVVAETARLVGQSRVLGAGEAAEVISGTEFGAMERERLWPVFIDAFDEGWQRRRPPVRRRDVVGIRDEDGA